MSAMLMRAAALAGLVAGTAAAGCADAQAVQGGLASRVAAAPADGEVWMHFASRPGVCGGENNISTHREGNMVIDGSYNRHGSDWECVEGPVWVALERQGARVSGVRVRVARPWAREGRGTVTDLGAVGVREASDYLLDLAERGGNGDVGEKALLPATLADSVTTWPRLLRIARNAGANDEVRKGAVFWLSQQAGDRITAELGSLVNDDNEERELRKHAVFALSQRPREEAVPELLRIARTHHDPEIRKTAMFWLGQSHDPRALALFEEILAH
jgi:hypothetical protein